MTGTPRGLTDPPHFPHALAQIQLSGAIFLRGEYTEAWAYESLPSKDVAAVLAPDAAQIVLFHVVVSGQLLDRGRVAQGLGPRGRRHRAAVQRPAPDGRHMRRPSSCPIIAAHRPAAVDRDAAHRPWPRRGAQRGRLRLPRLRRPAVRPALGVFPPVFVVTPPDGTGPIWVKASSDLVLQQTSQVTDDRIAAPTDIPQLLLREVLKLHLANAPATDTGWLAALHDPVRRAGARRDPRRPGPQVDACRPGPRGRPSRPPCSTSASARCSASHRSATSPAGGCTSPRTCCARTTLPVTADRAPSRLRVGGGLQPSLQARPRRQHPASGGSPAHTWAVAPA